MKILRWIGFIPLSFIGAVIAGVFGNLLGSITNYYFALELSYFPEAYSGAMSALAFIVIGLFISPSRTPMMKNILIVLAAFIGTVSAIGSFMTDGNVTGLAMIIGALSMFTMKIDTFTELFEKKKKPNAYSSPKTNLL